MGSPPSSPCMMCESPTCYCCRPVRCIPQEPTKPPRPCKIFIKRKSGVCADLRSLDFFNYVGNFITFVALSLFLLTFLELLIFHYITSHGGTKSVGVASVRAETTEGEPTQAVDLSGGAPIIEIDDETSEKEEMRTAERAAENEIFIEDSSAGETAEEAATAFKEKKIIEKKVSTDEEEIPVVKKKIKGEDKEEEKEEGEKEEEEDRKEEEAKEEEEEDEEEEESVKETALEKDTAKIEQGTVMAGQKQTREYPAATKSKTRKQLEKEKEEKRTKAIFEEVVSDKSFKPPFKASSQEKAEGEPFATDDTSDHTTVEDGWEPFRKVPVSDQKKASLYRTERPGTYADESQDDEERKVFRDRNVESLDGRQPSYGKMRETGMARASDDLRPAYQPFMGTDGRPSTSHEAESDVPKWVAGMSQFFGGAKDGSAQKGPVSELEMSSKGGISGAPRVYGLESAQAGISGAPRVYGPKSAQAGISGAPRVYGLESAQAAADLPRSRKELRIYEGEEIAKTGVESWMHRPRYHRSPQRDYRATLLQKRKIRVVRDDETRIKVASGDRLVIKRAKGGTSTMSLAPGEKQVLELNKGDKVMLDLAGGDLKNVKVKSGGKLMDERGGKRMMIQIGDGKRIVQLEGAERRGPGQGKGSKRKIELASRDKLYFADTGDTSQKLFTVAGARDPSGKLKVDVDSSERRKAKPVDAKCKKGKGGGMGEEMTRCHKDASRSYFWHMFWGNG